MADDSWSNLAAALVTAGAIRKEKGRSDNPLQPFDFRSG
jgi:hypothetical protein